MIEEVTNIERTLVMGDATNRESVPGDTRWQLEGDLLAHAEFVDLDPTYSILTRADPSEDGPARLQSYAIIRVGLDDPWTRKDLQGGVLVFVWLVDRKPVRIHLSPASTRPVRPPPYAAIACLELDEETVQGAPVVLLSTESGWARPEKQFNDDLANHALAELQLGSDEGFKDALASLESINVRAVPDGATLLHLAACSGNTSAVSTLLDHGAGAKITNRNGKSAIHFAAANGRTGTITQLVSAGARPLVQDRYDVSALDLATNAGHLEAAVALQGSSTTPRSADIMALALARRDLETAKSLITASKAKLIRKMNADQFEAAIGTGDPAIVSFLLQHGMKPDHRPDDFPVLVIAAATGSRGAVSTLVDAGANVNRVARNGITPLMAASISGNAETVEYLLERGASVEATDRSRLGALDHAILAGQDRIAEILRSKGAEETPANKRRPLDSHDIAVRLARLVRQSEPVASGSELPVAPTVSKTVPISPIMRTDVSRAPVIVDYAYAATSQPGTPIYQGTRTEMQSTTSSYSMRSQWAAISLIVGPDGTPSHIRTIDSDSRNQPELIEAVEQAVLEYRFFPGMLDGQPVRSRIALVVVPEDSK